MQCGSIVAVTTDGLLTTQQFADGLGKSVWTVSRLVREGHLEPALRAPGSRGAMWFTQAQLDDFLTESEA